MKQTNTNQKDKKQRKAIITIEELKRLYKNMPDYIDKETKELMEKYGL